MSTLTSPSPPLVAHVIFRLGVGGLENGLVNLINHMPAGRYRHAIVCLTQSLDFRNRIQRPDVTIHELRKQEGNDPGVHVRLWRVLRSLRPAILHSRNLGALDSAFAARAAGVRRHVHGLHGWDVTDLHGKNRKYALLRRICDPLVTRYIAVSRDLERWLTHEIRVKAKKVTQIYNGVDSTRFRPARPGEPRRAALPPGFAAEDSYVIGWVGRMDAVKNPSGLVEAAQALVAGDAQVRRRLRLVMVGPGPLAAGVAEELRAAGLDGQTWLSGSREDIADVLRALDLFVLTSLNEGISNTVLEAMASGLPVVASAVGGNGELVVDHQTGRLVPGGSASALAEAMAQYLRDPELGRRHGAEGRARVERQFSMEAMVNRYLQTYDRVLGKGDS